MSRHRKTISRRKRQKDAAGQRLTLEQLLEKLDRSYTTREHAPSAEDPSVRSLSLIDLHS